MKKIISFLMALMILSTFGFSAVADTTSDTLEIITFSVTDEDGKTLTKVADVEDKINVNAIAVNKGENEATVSLILGVYDAETNRMKAFFTSKKYTMPKYEKTNLAMTASLKNAEGIEMGDIIRIYFWNDVSGMIQLRDNINAENAKDYPTLYKTTVSGDFQSEINTVKGDRWSYISSSLNLEEDFSQGLLIGSNGKWWLDPNKEALGANWFISEDGFAMSEVGLGVGWNYTIGEFTENCNLVIEGSFGGVATTDLYVFISDYDTSSRVTVKNPKENLLLQTKAGKEFKIEIPAKYAIYGRNISFIANWNDWGYLGNTLNVTITATPSKNVSQNSIKNYSDENVLGAGKWSYIDAPAYSLTNGSFSYTGLLAKGDGNVYAEDEFAADITDSAHKYFINSLGEAYIDKNKMIGYVYTVGDEFDGAASAVVKGSGSCENSAFRIIAVKTSDGDENVIGDTATLLYNQSASSHSFSAELDLSDLKKGDDIIFMIKTTASNSKNPIKTDFSVIGLFEE